MPTRPEHPAIQAERRNRRFEAFVSALGLATIIGSLAIPTHERPLKDLQVGLDAGGSYLVLKGFMRSIQAKNRLDELQELSGRNE